MIYILLAIGATLIILIIGVIFMAIGGKIDKKYSSKLMLFRVVSQAAAIAIVAALYFLKQSGSS
jgi:Hypoxia induced protein conserved region